MPKIKVEEINDEYLEKYIATAIMPNGEIVSVEVAPNETFHSQSFLRLIIEINQIYNNNFKMLYVDFNEIYLSKLKNKEDAHNIDLAKAFQKNGIAIFYSYSPRKHRSYVVSDDIQLIRLPKKPKLKQYTCLKKIAESGIFDMIDFLEFEQEGTDINAEDNEGADKFKDFLNERIIDAR